MMSVAHPDLSNHQLKNFEYPDKPYDFHLANTCDTSVERVR
jgi:hypothetical protein